MEKPKEIFTFSQNEQVTVRMPQLCDWQAKINGLTYRPYKHQEPNAFHRLMQRLCFGVKWERIK